MATGDVWLAVITLAGLAGLLGRRGWVYVAPVLLTVTMFVGLDHGWWGGRLADGWRSVFATALFLALLATSFALGLGWALDGLGRADRDGRWTPRWSAAVVAVWAIGAGVYTYAQTRPANVSAIREAPGPELYYLGDSFEGMRLTRATVYAPYATFVYGACHETVPPAEGPGCTPPLSITNIACHGKPTLVGIGGLDWNRAQRAAAALILLRGRGGSPRVAVMENLVHPCAR